MIAVTVSREIEAEAAELFAFLSDSSNNPTWQQGMERCTWLSEPPIGVGAVYQQEARFLGRPILSTFDVTEFEPGRKIRIVTTESTIPLDITRTVEPLGPARSRATALIRGGPTGFASRFDALTRRLVSRNVEADYDRLVAHFAP